MQRTYGKLYLSEDKKHWMINNAEPHVCIKLKAIFTKIHTGQTQPFKFIRTDETCRELLWFIDRYPMEITEGNLSLLKKGKKGHITSINELEAILLPDYIPLPITLNEPYEARHYQLSGKDIYLKCKRILIGDEIGLGKTLIGIISCLEKVTRPCVVTVQTHLPKQWKKAIEQFTDLKVHVIKGTKPYNLPTADIYITKYSCLAGWTNVFETSIFNSAIFDEIQELRHEGTGKYNGAMALSKNVDYVLGLSYTPIYNYGDETYNIFNIIKPDCLGYRDDFLREWTGYSKLVKDPKALGAYLREQMLFLKRTRKEVGRELPPLNTIVHTVEYDSEEVEKAEHIAKQLAIKSTSGSFMERGQAARELDIYVRHYTGVAKAKGVSEYVKILLDNNIPIILAGWHRDVYEIWLEELKDYNPVMYTGSESPKQKEESKRKFVDKETNLFIISLRSGAGLDGLQEVCETVIIGELDFSPKVHDQLIGRSNRDKADGTPNNVTAIYLVSDCGSDPVIIDMLSIKSSQSQGIFDPFDNNVPEKYSDESRIQLLAQKYLKKHEGKTTN